MSSLRLRDSIMTMSTVWRRAFADAVFAPTRFRRVMPEFRKVSDMLFHPGIGDFDVSQLPAPDSTIEMLPVSPGYGGMPAQDLYALLRVIRWIQPRRVFEIGTFQGVTTAHMAINCDAEICTLDLPRDQASEVEGYSENDLHLLQRREEIGQAYRPFNSDSRVHQLFGDSRSFDYCPYLGLMDFVLVDACHLFDYVTSDSRIALRLLAERGVILWHDFGNSRDVVRALRKMATTIPIVHLEGTALALHARGISIPARALASAGYAPPQKVA